MQTFIRQFTQDLNKQPVFQHSGLVFCGDNATPEIKVHVTRDGFPVSLGGSVAGTVTRSDGSTVPLTGTVSGGDVSVIMSEACFAVPGRIELSVIVTDGTTVMTVLHVAFTVVPTETPTIIDPDSEVALNVADLVSQIDTATASVPADYSDLLAAIAPTFSNTEEYKAGRFVWYDGALYQFVADHAAGTWAAADVKSVTIFGTIEDIQYILSQTTAETRNLWQNGDFAVTDASTGYNQFLLRRPLPAGTYILSGIADTDNTGGICRFRFSTSQDPTALPSSSFVGDADLTASGARESVTVTITDTVYSVRVFAGTNTTNAKTHTAEFESVQIETTARLSDYIPPLTATDWEARVNVGNLRAVTDTLIDTQSNALTVTPGISDTNNGVTRYEADGKLRLTGTSTAARWLAVFNGANAARTAAGAFIRTVPAGQYTVGISCEGVGSVDILSATYTTFAAPIDTTDGGFINLTEPAMIGIYIPVGVNFGDYDPDTNPNGTYTDVTVEMHRVIPIVDNNPYAKHVLKRPGALSASGFAHQGFPDVAWCNGNRVLVSRVSASHYTPTNSDEWGGLEIDTISPGGDVTYIKTLTAADIPGLQGELRDCYIYTTRYGLLMCGWTTYYSGGSAAHDGFLAQLSARSFAVIDSIVNPVTPSISGTDVTLSFTGKPLLTPTGHIIATAYRAGRIWIVRSDDVFDGTNLSEMTYTATRLIDNEESTDGNEASLGYNNNTLYLLARNSTSRLASCLYRTDNLEGTDGWEVLYEYDRATDGIDTVIHSPRLLPHTSTPYLIFAGANYRSASKRNAVLGYIDLSGTPEDKRLPVLGILDSTLNYGGYTGITSFSGEEFDVAYYQDGKDTTAATALESGLYYRRVSTRMFFPWLFE